MRAAYRPAHVVVFRMEIRRRHLAVIPAFAAALAAILCLGIVKGIDGVLIVLIVYFGTGLLLAAFETLLTPWRAWRWERRRDHEIEASIIPLHPPKPAHHARMHSRAFSYPHPSPRRSTPA